MISHKLYSRAFALPTVLITSAVMMIVLLIALASVSSITVSLEGQYYNKLAQEASESGLEMAKACIIKNGPPTWSDTSPLHPNTGCGGGASCSDTSQCFLLSDGNTKSSFSVGTPKLNTDGSYSIPVSATVQLLRTSNGAVWKTYNDKIVPKVTIGWKKVSGGFADACGISYTNKVYCWGNNDYGSLGNGTTTSSNVPVPVYTGGALQGKLVTDIFTEGSYSCVVASDHHNYCWGSNKNGMLGNGTTTDSNVPVAMVQGDMPAGVYLKFIEFNDISTEACGIGSDNKAYCWGYNNLGQVGDNTRTPRYVPTAVYTGGVLNGKRIIDISIANGSTTCAVASDQKPYCWGYGLDGGLGNQQESSSSNIPVAVYTGGALSGKHVIQVSGTCALTSEKRVYCWDDNYYGQLGNNTAMGTYTTEADEPVAVYTAGAMSGKDIVQISGTNVTRCARSSDNDIFCWGSNQGNYGNGTTANSNVPVKVNTSGVLSDKVITHLQSNATAFALTDFGRFYANGTNYFGTFGNGTTDNNGYNYTLGGAVDDTIIY